MSYRPEIDGLRAVSVILVILFHVGMESFSAGYIGVDIFFVISGFLITGIITDELDNQKFSVLGFYARRIARLFPALIITLLATYISGFLLYNELIFDRLGKQIAFSSCGVANLLFAQGSNYFTQDPRAHPLIHLWSLGVEEQFYLFWPSILLLYFRYRRSFLLWSMILLCLGSLVWAEVVVHTAPIEAYFYPQYRACELLLGAIGAELLRRYPGLANTGMQQRELLTGSGLLGVVVGFLLLDKHSTFPGLHALLPCLGTLLFLLFAQGTRLAAMFSLRPFVVVGLISYPLYLFHYPLITFLLHHDASIGSGALLACVLLIAVPLSYVTYRFCEKPIQRLVREQDRRAKVCVWSLIGAMAVMCGLGVITARLEGLPWRFAQFNPFALTVTERNRPPFFEAYPQGIVLSGHPQPDALFIGDSVLQQYVPSLITAFGIAPDRFDLVTRSGCVLLKDADFTDQYSTIPSSELYAHLYARPLKTYRYIFISQDWTLYDGRIGNFDAVTTGPAVEKWRSLIDRTIRYHQQHGGTVVLLGLHPLISGTDAISPNLLLSEADYRSRLPGLAISNQADLPAARRFFDQWHHPPATIVLHPSELWMDDRGMPLVHDGRWSYFFDTRHIGSGSVDRATERLIPMVRERSRTTAAP